eukprot:162164_1
MLSTKKLDKLISGYIFVNKVQNIGCNVHDLIFNFCLSFATKILNENEIDTLLSFLSQQKFWNLSDFHHMFLFDQKLNVENNHPNIKTKYDESHSLIILRSNDNNNIYGGFTPFDWNVTKNNFKINYANHRVYEWIGPYHAMTRISRPPNAYGDTQSFFFQISDNIINEISENNLGNINYNIQSFEIFQLNEYEHIRHKVDRILYQLVKDIGN